MLKWAAFIGRTFQDSVFINSGTGGKCSVHSEYNSKKVSQRPSRIREKEATARPCSVGRCRWAKLPLESRSPAGDIEKSPAVPKALLLKALRAASSSSTGLFRCRKEQQSADFGDSRERARARLKSHYCPIEDSSERSCLNLVWPCLVLEDIQLQEIVCITESSHQMIDSKVKKGFT